MPEDPKIADHSKNLSIKGERFSEKMKILLETMIYSDKALSQKLERTEACANAEFVSSRLKMYPDSCAEWLEVNGTYAMFDGIESPLTQTFGLGLFEALTQADLDAIENFYRRFSAPIFHEVSPMSDPQHLEILYQRNYQPVELSTILYKQLTNEDSAHYENNPQVTARHLRKGEEKLWVSTSVEGWSAEMPVFPDFSEFLYQFSHIGVYSAGAWPFFAELNGKPISTGMLYMYDDIALLSGDSTIPEGRKRGGQKALIDARLSFAAAQGCTIAMMAASPGSHSQKNAEKNGFNIAYTRTKWKLSL